MHTDIRTRACMHPRIERDREADSKGILARHPIHPTSKSGLLPSRAMASLKGTASSPGSLVDMSILQLLLVLLLLRRRLTTPATVAAHAISALWQGRIICRKVHKPAALKQATHTQISSTQLNSTQPNQRVLSNIASCATSSTPSPSCAANMRPPNVDIPRFIVVRT